MVQEGTGRLAERLAKRMNTSFNNARRLVETETAYIQERASLDAYDKLKVEKYEILATLDNRTSDTCKHLDGKVFDKKDAQPGITMPPFHCYCRSTTIPYIEGLDDETRAARDPKTGKTVFVEGDLTSSEWYNKYVRSTEVPTGQGNHSFDGNGRIKVTENHSKDERYSPNIKAEPNAVIKHWSKGDGGKQANIILYDSNGFVYKRLHYGNHGFPKKHNFGTTDEPIYEHTHIVGYDENNKPNKKLDVVRAMSDTEKRYLK